MSQFGSQGGSFGPNAWLVDDMYDRFLADPDSVSESWREFFADYRPAPVPAPQPPTQSQAPAPAAPAPAVAGPSKAAPTSTAPVAAAASAAPPAATEREKEEATPLRGAASRIVANMEASLSVPTATSVRTVPARLLEVNRLILNNQLARTTGAKVSFTHIIGYAVVRALQDVPALNAAFVPDVDGKGKPGVIHHKHVGLGLAVDQEKSDGSRTLLVPCIKDADALQTYFTRRIGRYLLAHGRRPVGWDEILQPGLSSDAVVMAWHGAKAARAAALAGNDTVLAPAPVMYFDNRQSTLPSEPTGRIAVDSLEGVYGFDLQEANLSPSQQRHLLGLEAGLWTEHIQTEQRLEWMALPRAAAVAEVGWSGAARNWSDFLARVNAMAARYEKFDLHYADSVFGIEARFAPEAGARIAGARTAGAIQVTLANQPELQNAALDTGIRYTLDGEAPNSASARYAGPFSVAPGAEIRAATFIGGRQAARARDWRVDVHSAARRSSQQLDLCSNGIGLLLEPRNAANGDAPLAVDIMNPCWLYRGVDLEHGAKITAAVFALPFNYELGPDAATIRVGDNQTPAGELQVRLDACDGTILSTVPLPPAAGADRRTELPPQMLAPVSGRHDLCLRFARPSLDPMWGIDWVEIGN